MDLLLLPIDSPLRDRRLSPLGISMSFPFRSTEALREKGTKKGSEPDSGDADFEVEINAVAGIRGYDRRLSPSLLSLLLCAISALSVLAIFAALFRLSLVTRALTDVLANIGIEETLLFFKVVGSKSL